MNGLLDLTNSERGLMALLLIAGATVLVALGKVSFSDWEKYTLTVLVVYTGGKTVTSTAGILKGKG